MRVRPIFAYWCACAQTHVEYSMCGGCESAEVGGTPQRRSPFTGLDDGPYLPGKGPHRAGEFAGLLPYPDRDHFGDPCIHCGVAHDDVPSGPCAGDPKKARPIAWCSMGVRWDGVEHYRIRMSSGEVVDRWEHVAFHLPYYHFGHSDALTSPLCYDEGDRAGVSTPSDLDKGLQRARRRDRAVATGEQRADARQSRPRRTDIRGDAARRSEQDRQGAVLVQEHVIR